MSFPICESRPCKDRSQYYIIDKKVYVCHTHKATKYSSDDFIQLIPPDSIRLILKVVDQCRMKLLVSPSTQGYHASEIEYNILDTTITEAINQILSRLRTAVGNKQFFKLEALFQEAKQLEDFIMNDQLFIKYSTTKSWKKALAVVEGTAEKSAALVTKELREKYDSAIKRTLGELKKQRDRILEEKSRLNIKLSEEKTRFNDLEEKLKNKEKSFEQDLKKQKEEYKENKEGLLSINSTLIEEAKEREQEISKLNEDIKNKSEDLKESKQKLELSNEKSKERRERIEVWKSRLAKEKEELEVIKAQLQQEKNDYDVQLKESSEKSEKNLQEELAVFNNKYKEKNDAIHKLEKEVSKLTEELNQKRKNQQALKVAHTNLQIEKQSIVEKHAEDTSKLQQNNEALEEESKGKDINIMELKEEIEELAKKLEDAHEHNKSIKLNLASSIQTYSNQELTDLCKDYRVYKEFGKTMQFDQKTWLLLDLSEGNHLELLTKITKRIPDCKSIGTASIPGESEVVKTFLSLYFPNKVGQFSFNYFSDLSSCLSFYMTELEALSSKVEQAFVIYNFEVSQHQMKTLLAKYKRKIDFGFKFCKLALSSVPDFGGALQGSQLEVLVLNGCGSSDLGDWKNNLAHFENLMEGLAKEQDFRNNLKRIEVWSCGMEESQIEEILKKYEFGEVEISGLWLV